MPTLRISFVFQGSFHAFLPRGSEGKEEEEGYFLMELRLRRLRF